MGTVTAHRGLEQVRRRTSLFPSCRALHVGLYGCFRVAFLLSLFFIWMFLQLTHPHTSNRCTAQLKSMLFCSDSAQSDTRRKDQSVKTRVMKHLVGSAGYMSENNDAQALRGCCCICNAYDDAFIIRFKFIPWLILHYAHK